jgi:serine/threonine-protein kinase
MSQTEHSPTQPASAVPDDPYIGALVGERYRVLARLGEGGMGAVYRAEHVHMRKEVALKLLHGELGRVDEAVRRFEREAQSASRLSHPSIIAVTDFGRAASGELYLAMEYVKGESLADVLARERRLPLGRALEILRQVLSALDHAHGQGVVHRDLKPANLMLTVDPATGGDRVKILDFGIAKMSQGAEGERFTQGAMVFGTPSYMSPEQATAQDVDLRSDLYACGVMLFEMILGRKPFVAEDLVRVMAMHVTQPPPPFASVAPELALPPALELAVQRALEKDRTRRYQSASEFAAALEGLEGLPRLRTIVAKLQTVAQTITQPVVGQLRGAYARLPWKVRRFTPVAGALGVVLLLVLVPSLCSKAPGPVPIAAPPPPKPVAPAVQSDLARVEDAMGAGKLIEARAMLLRLLTEHPKAGRVHHVLGNLEFVERKVRAGVDAYAEALRLDPGLRADAALLVNVKAALADKQHGRAALDLLIAQVGRPAATTLAQVGSEDRRSEFRRAAREACGRLDCGDRLDLVGSLALDLKDGKPCSDDRREAIRGLAATKSPRAVDVLKKARGVRGNPLDRLLGGGGGNECLRKDFDAALKELGAE